MVGLNRHVGSNPTLSAIDLAVCQKKVTDCRTVSDGLQELRMLLRQLPRPWADIRVNDRDIRYRVHR